MTLHQISESESDIIVGIDLGTTNSLISYFDGNTIQIVPDQYNIDGIVPSVVAYTKDKTIVGTEALRIQNHIKSVKRLMNNSSSAISGDITPITVSAEILKYLKCNIEKYLNIRVQKAVITVPAHFDDNARNAVKSAAEIAGLEVIRILNEPTAAAIAYGLNAELYDTMLVYDLGGGTFDVSILKTQNSIISVIATGGDNALGGDDFDFELLKLMCDKLQLSIDELLTQENLYVASDCKKQLSTQNIWHGILGGYQISITQDEANTVWHSLIIKTIKVVREVLFASKLQPQDIKHVILAGGGSKIPAVRHAIQHLFNIQPLDKIDPDIVVVIGAGLQAKALAYGGHTLVDVVPLSLGIELLGNIIEQVIKRNTPIPAMVKKVYTTYRDNQTGFKIHIVQGEGDTVEKCKSLGEFKITGLTPKPAGDVRLEVVFKVDTNGLLIVTATELDSGQCCKIEIKAS